MDEQLNSGVIWEPRVLWDVQNNFEETLGVLDSIQQIKFSKYNFRNGGQYPIELRYMMIAPVGYAFTEYLGLTNPPSNATGDYGACAAVIQKSKIMVSVPNRQHYALSPLPVSTWALEPTADVYMQYSSATAATTASGLIGTCRWDFDRDRKLILPRRAACTLQLGAFTPQPNSLISNTPFYASIGFDETGVGHNGPKSFFANANQRNVVRTLSSSSITPVRLFPPADGLGVYAGQTNEEWPATSKMTFADYKAQETSRDGYNAVGGFSVAINQIAYDEALRTEAPNGTTSIVAPLALRLPVRAACDAMSQEWWWRDGAPLALVCPTMTPALVYRLPRPLTLHKGDHIEVEMQLPGATNIEASSPDEVVNPLFQIGVSFAGYAAIKG